MSYRVKWVPTALFIPLLYILGWLIVQPLKLSGITFFLEKASLLGSIVSLLLFVYLLPSWNQIRWQGLYKISKGKFYRLLHYHPLRNFIWGFLISFGMIAFILFLLTITSCVEWRLDFKIVDLVDSIFLCLFVGFFEELIFRGWLATEMNCLYGYKKGNILQATIFSLVHFRTGMSFLEATCLTIGLFLFGLVLAQRRNLNDGSLWGSIGLHGGLVGVWFLVQNSLVDFYPNRPSWLIGSGYPSPNPIGGVFGILILLLLYIIQRFGEVNSRRL